MKGDERVGEEVEWMRKRMKGAILVEDGERRTRVVVVVVVVGEERYGDAGVVVVVVEWGECGIWQ